MKTYKIKYFEKISLWQELESTVRVPDDFKLEDEKNYIEAIQEYRTDSKLLENFEETEEHEEYDFSNVEIEEE